VNLSGTLVVWLRRTLIPHVTVDRGKNDVNFRAEGTVLEQNLKVGKPKFVPVSSGNEPSN